MKMKQSILAILALAFSASIYAQPDNTLALGTIDSIQSNILHENRKLWVYVPNRGSRANALFSEQRYPVVYLLDGNAHFYSVAGMIQNLSQVNGNTVCPEMIVVGIPNTIRERDLTPTKAGDDPFLAEISRLRTTGGGENFISFIEKELIPYIDSNYPTQPYKMLIGHSFGGLAVMNTLLNHTKLFNSYIAIDPSMWWDNMHFLKSTKQGFREKDFDGTTLYLAVANTMDQDMDIHKVQTDTTVPTRGIRGTLSLDSFINKEKPKGLRYASKYYEDNTHNSVPLIATYDGLRFIFDKYELKIDRKDILDPSEPFAKKIHQRYEDISQLFGYEVKPPEKEINLWGYRFLQRKQFQKAEDFFKMNIYNYPESFNVYDSYGDFFVATGDKAKAVEQFKKALSLKENSDTQEKLDKLKQ